MELQEHSKSIHFVGVANTLRHEGYRWGNINQSKNNPFMAIFFIKILANPNGVQDQTIKNDSHTTYNYWIGI